MAIVKFTSNKDYQVFIDMELAGMVTPDSMLKVVLETGGYLIQIKDEDGNLIKEYEMEIKSSDNQLLQKIDSANNELEDIIENLKNDSSLVFHCERAAFCYNGLYGFVDKTFTVVIPPIYYCVNKFDNNKAFVVRDFPEGRKTTMIDRDGKMFFNRWFDYIGESDETILLGIEDRIIVYSKTKCDKVAEYFNAGYDKKASLVPVYKKVGAYNFYGYIDFYGKEAIPFIFNNVGNFNEKGEAAVVFLGRGVKISTKGYYRRVEEGFYDWMKWDENPIGLEGILGDDQDPRPWQYSTGETDWVFIPIWNNYKWVIRISINKVGPRKEIKRFDYNCDYVLRIEKGYVICKQADKVLVLIANIYNHGIEELTFDADDVVPVFDINHNLQGDDIITSRTFIIKRSNKYGVYNTLGEVLIPVEYDEIKPFEPYLFAVKKSGKYAVYSTGGLSDFEYDNVTYQFCDLLLEKSSKYGLWKNWSVIPPIYDSINSHGDRNIVSLNGKYGIIDDEQKEVLSINYEMIIPLGKSNIKIKTNKGWALGLIHHGGIVSEDYDDITLFTENGHDNIWIETFRVRKNNRIGCINNVGSILIPIDYNEIALCSSFYFPRRLSFILHKGNKVGFCEFSFDDDYSYIVKPSYDSCVLLENKKSVLTNFGMHYAAVQKDGKWGVLDQKPRKYTYFAIEINLRTSNKSNLKDLEFKYDSVEDLMEDADNEFQRRYEQYFKPWVQMRDENGEYSIFREDEFMV